MKKNKVEISIPHPCHENWHAMTPAQQGRHCGACQKVVVDFTMMTDGQILDVISKANGRIPCGRYLTSQLDRELIDTRPKTTFIGTLVKRMAAMVLLVQSAATAMAQQEKSHIVTVEQYEEYDKKSLGLIQVSGKLTDVLSKQCLPHVSVYIRQINTTVFTDTAGLFSFIMPANLDSVSVLVNHKPYIDSTEVITMLQPPIAPILEQTIAVNKTKNGGEITVSVSYQPLSLALENPPVAMGVWPGPITTIDWVKNTSVIVYTIPKADSTPAKPFMRLPKDVVAARSEKTVWGRLTNYWLGKKK